MAEGDAVDVLAGEAGSATPEYMEELRKKFGLDQPLPVQLMVYLKNVVMLDLGYSSKPLCLYRNWSSDGLFSNLRSRIW